MLASPKAGMNLASFVESGPADRRCVGSSTRFSPSNPSSALSADASLLLLLLPPVGHRRRLAHCGWKGAHGLQRLCGEVGHRYSGDVRA